MKKKFTVDYSNLKSIKTAERKKTRLENRGYKVINTRQTGLNKFTLSMSKIKRKKGWRNESTRHSLARKGIKTGQKSKLIITGKKPYIKKMFKHLRKEHPSTKKKMICVNCQKTSCKGCVETKKGIRNEINSLLYKKSPACRDKKILTVIVPRSKSHFLNFLEASTEWKTEGVWKGAKKVYRDDNTLYEIEFKDDMHKNKSKTLKRKFEQLNKQQIHEEQLYVRITDIESSTL